MTEATIYELLTKEIFEAILNQSDVKNIAVRHNIILQGKTTAHQIDVYWKFELGGITYQTIVQAKNWNYPISKGALLQFKEILNDLPGQPKGIFVTKSGYQKGATEVATANGIDLLQLKEIENAHIEIQLYGYARTRLIAEHILVTGTNSTSITLGIEYTVYESKFENNIVNGDIEWVNQRPEFERVNIQSKFLKKQATLKQPSEHKFYDEAGNIINDLGKIYLDHIDKIERGRNLRQNMIYKFESPTYIRLDDLELKLLKVLSVSTDVTIKESEQKRILFSLPDIVQFRLKDITKNTERILGKNKI